MGPETNHVAPAMAMVYVPFVVSTSTYMVLCCPPDHIPSGVRLAVFWCCATDVLLCGVRFSCRGAVWTCGRGVGVAVTTLEGAVHPTTMYVVTNTTHVMVCVCGVRRMIHAARIAHAL